MGNCVLGTQIRDNEGAIQRSCHRDCPIEGLGLGCEAAEETETTQMSCANRMLTIDLTSTHMLSYALSKDQ